MGDGIIIGKYTAKLTFLWHGNFGKNCTPLQRNGMAAIPKITRKSLSDATFIWAFSESPT